MGAGLTFRVFTLSTLSDGDHTCDTVLSVEPVSEQPSTSMNFAPSRRDEKVEMREETEPNG